MATQLKGILRLQKLVKSKLGSVVTCFATMLVLQTGGLIVRPNTVHYQQV